MSESRKILVLSGLSGAAGILIGAFGAHLLPQLLEGLDAETVKQRKEWLETGAQYHMYHAVALLVISCANPYPKSFYPSAIAWMIGILLFSGTLYVMTLTGVRPLGAVVPLGGISFAIGWGLLLGTKSQNKRQ